MNLYEAIKKHSEITLDDFKEYKRNVLDFFEQYEEDMLNDDSDAFSGTEDSYANEMLDQRLSEYLFDLFCGVMDENKANKYANFCTGKIIEAYFNNPKDQNEILRTFATYKSFHDGGLNESVITKDDLTADVKRDLNIEPGSDEEYELDNLYALRDLDAWIEDLYDDGESREEIKNKFAIEDIALHYGMSEEELDSKVNEVCSKVDKLWDDHEKFMQSLRNKKEADGLDSFEMSYLSFYDNLVDAIYQNNGYVHFPAREISSDELDALKKIILSKGGEDLGENKFSNDGIIFELSPSTGLTLTFDNSKDYKVVPMNDAEIHTMDNDPSWAAAVNKVNKEYSKNKSKISDDIAKEYARFTKKLTSSGLFKPEDVWELPEGKAYRDAIKDPEDIWCECSGDTDSKFKPDGTSYLGVSKHGYICNKCKKFTQIG